LAQSLFDGGKISYHRTDSFKLSDDSVTAVRQYIKDKFEPGYLPTKPNIYDQKSTAAAQEAHEAIRPTDVQDEGNGLNGDEFELYKLIRSRFIACQMSDQVLDTVVYRIKASSGHELIAKGQSVRFDGWKLVYAYAKPTKEIVLPAAEDGAELTLSDTRNTKHSTKPPERYNDGNLINRLKTLGVGRPSTWQTIPTTLIERMYATREGKAFVATDLGKRVCEFLLKNHGDFFMGLDFSSSLELDLRDIADGKKKFLPVVQGFYDILAKKIGPAIRGDTLTGKACPECGKGQVVEKYGNFGKYFACNNYPDCKAKLTEVNGLFVKKAEPKKTGSACPVCKDGQIQEREGKFGPWFSCNRFPACKAKFNKKGDEFLVKA